MERKIDWQAEQDCDTLVIEQLESTGFALFDNELAFTIDREIRNDRKRYKAAVRVAKERLAELKKIEGATH